LVDLLESKTKVEARDTLLNKYIKKIYPHCVENVNEDELSYNVGRDNGHENHVKKLFIFSMLLRLMSCII
jgi:hypothetical protein